MKGGYSETRIEKRIIITGDDDVDQDQVGAEGTRAGYFSVHFIDIYNSRRVSSLKNVVIIYSHSD